MVDLAEFLRRRIALYRQYLREGVDAALAEIYLQQIAADEAEPARFEDGDKRRR